MGDVAAACDFGGQQGRGAFGAGGGSERLTVDGLKTELHDLAAATGSGSQDRRLDRLFGLFNRCAPAEARYLPRIVLSECVSASVTEPSEAQSPRLLSAHCR